MMWVGCRAHVDANGNSPVAENRRDGVVSKPVGGGGYRAPVKKFKISPNVSGNFPFVSEHISFRLLVATALWF